MTHHRRDLVIDHAGRELYEADPAYRRRVETTLTFARARLADELEELGRTILKAVTGHRLPPSDP